jgi:hypothetical protein
MTSLRSKWTAGWGKRIGGSACRRVGVCKESSASWIPPGQCSHVEKQSYLPRRRPADTLPQPPAHFQRNPPGHGQLAVFPRCSLDPYESDNSACVNPRHLIALPEAVHREVHSHPERTEMIYRDW